MQDGELHPPNEHPGRPRRSWVEESGDLLTVDEEGAAPGPERFASRDVPLRAMIEHHELLMWIVDPDGILQEANERALAFLGAEPEAVIGHPVWDTGWWSHSPLLQARLLEELESALRGEAVSFEATHPRRDMDGLLAPVWCSARAVRGECGEVRFLILESRDLTDERGLQDRLDARETSLRAIFNSPNAIVSMDEWGCIDEFNRAAEEIFGYTAAEVVGRSVSVLLPRLERSPTRDTRPPNAEGEDVEERRQVLGRRKDGSTLPLELTMGDSQLAGERRFVGILRDVSDRVSAEDEIREGAARLRRARELADIGVVEIRTPFGAQDADWSEEVFHIFRLDPMSGPPSLERGLSELVHPDDRETVERELRLAALERRPAEIESRVRRGDGSTGHVQGRFEAELDEWGRISRWIGAVRDVTEQRQLERELLHAQKMEAIARLTAGIAHEYNNLLMGIQGCTKLALRRMGVDHPGGKFVVEAERAAERGAALTQQLLEFSARREPAEGIVDLDGLIERTTRMLRAVLGERIELNLRLGVRQWRLCGDPAHVEQVIMNLVINARDAMPEGGQLRLETSEVAVGVSSPAALNPGVEPGDYVVLTVGDTGTGMDEETLERVFEPFFTTKRTGEGSGLGLSTVYGIVHAGGGDISVESELGSGTTFTLFFPRAAAEDARNGSSAKSVTAPRQGRERILIVEDEPLIRMTLKGYLEPCGHEVVEACDASEASLYLQRDQARFDLVITDVMLPGGTGRHVADQVWASSPETPVIFMSAHPADVLLRAGRIPSGAVLMQKPFSEGALMAEIRRALGPGLASRPPPPPDLSGS